MKNRKSGEARLIEHIEKTFKFPLDRRLLLGPGDDCAVLRHVPGRNLVITTDEIVEGTHYLARFATPEDLARKLTRINLSDLASMGEVKPVSCVVGAGLKKNTPKDFILRFMRELKAEALRFGISIAGGNLAGARENHFYMTVWGESGGSELVTRYGAKPGDLLFNIGQLGLAAAGLERLLSRVFKTVQLMGVRASAEAERLEARRVRSLVRLHRLDPFRLRRWIPASVQSAVLGSLAWLRQRRGSLEGSACREEDLMGFRAQEESLEESLDLIALCRTVQ